MYCIFVEQCNKNKLKRKQWWAEMPWVKCISTKNQHMFYFKCFFPSFLKDESHFLSWNMLSISSHVKQPSLDHRRLEVPRKIWGHFFALQFLILIWMLNLATANFEYLRMLTIGPILKDFIQTFCQLILKLFIEFSNKFGNLLENFIEFFLLMRFILTL